MLFTEFEVWPSARELRVPSALWPAGNPAKQDSWLGRQNRRNRPLLMEQSIPAESNSSIKITHQRNILNPMLAIAGNAVRPVGGPEREHRRRRQPSRQHRGRWSA